MRIMLVFIALKILCGCAFNTSARSFKPTHFTFSSKSYDIEIRSGFEMTKARTVFLYIPTGHEETYERAPQRTIQLAISPKCTDLELDLSRVVLDGGDLGVRTPVSVREHKGTQRNTVLKKLEDHEMKIEFERKIRSFSLDYDVSGFNVGDRVRLKISSISCNEKSLPEEVATFKEGTISFHRN